MRKILCAFATLVAISSLSAQTAILFPGTFSKYTDPLLGNTAPRKDTAIVPMETSLLDAYATFKTVERPVLIGHSQGGSRALSYAAYLASEQNTTAEGVISLGGPVRGFTPLKGGKAVMTWRISELVCDIAEGIDAILYSNFSPGIGPFAAMPVFQMGLGIAAAIISGKEDSGLATKDELFLMAVSGRVPANDEASAFGISNQLIADLTPDSAYQYKYLTPKRVAVRGHYEKVKDGGYYKYVWSHKKMGWLGNVGYWKLEWVDAYKSVWREPTYADDPPKLRPETRVAYLYGNNKSLRAFANEYYEGSPDAKEQAFANIEGGCSALGNLETRAGVMCGCYFVLDTTLATISYASANIPAGLWYTAKAVADAVEAQNAFDAATLLLDLDSTVNKRIYNTTSSDGFVTADSTSLPLSVTGGKSWTNVKDNSGKEIADVESYFVTHQRLHYDERIWGVGGAMGNDIDDGEMPIQDGGRIADLLSFGSPEMRLGIIINKKQLVFD